MAGELWFEVNMLFGW